MIFQINKIKQQTELYQSAMVKAFTASIHQNRQVKKIKRSKDTKNHHKILLLRHLIKQ